MFSCLLVTADNILTIAAAIVVVCILVALGFSWFYFFERAVDKDKKSNPTDDEENFEIKISRYLIGTMIFFVVIFGVFAAVCLILYLAKVPELSLETTVLATCIFGGAALCIAVFCVSTKKWRVVVRGDKITYSRFGGKKREFLWEDISKVEKVSNADSLIKVYFNGDKKPAFTLNGVQTGVGLFIKKLQKSGKLFL